jgi:hypothetical protein
VAALKTILEQALQLSDDERGELIGQLLRSLEPDDGEVLSADEWVAACPVSSVSVRTRSVTARSS